MMIFNQGMLLLGSNHFIIIVIVIVMMIMIMMMMMMIIIFYGLGPFLESSETFRAHFVWHNSLCIFKTKAFRGTKLCSYFNLYSLYNLWTDQLNRLSRSEFHEWLFGPEKFSGLSRNGPLVLYEPRCKWWPYLLFVCLDPGFLSGVLLPFCWSFLLKENNTERI